MRPVILYRPVDGLDTTEEDVAKEILPVIRQRTDVQRGDLVIGRYSVLPFYRELERDVGHLGGMLINSTSEHNFIADVMEWAPILGEELTPRTWDSLERLPDTGVSFVVKGQTNSRKDRWDTHMFAGNKRDAVDVTLRLQEDGLIQSQRIYYRKYEKLRRYFTAMNGLPVSDEYRFFLLDGEVLSAAFYWSSHVSDLTVVPVPEEKHYEIVRKAVAKLRAAETLPKFLVMDVATKYNGYPIIIELNDGQMSGLSENDPKQLYENLKHQLGRRGRGGSTPDSKPGQG